MQLVQCHYMFLQFGIQLWPVQLPEIITGRAVEERIAIVYARGNNAERNTGPVHG